MAPRRWQPGTTPASASTRRRAAICFAEVSIRRKISRYFLFGLTQEQLSRASFPVGDMSKDKVRDIARTLGLSVAEKPDSQEICFVPDGDYAAFIERQTGALDSGGAIVNQSGDVVGQHAGVHRYTVGQRKGLGIAAPEPMYVLQIRPAEKSIVVGPRPELERSSLTASRVNWISGHPPADGARVAAQIRHRNQPAQGRVRTFADDRAHMDFDAPVSAITPGQAVVFYDGDLVLGGGWID